MTNVAPQMANGKSPRQLGDLPRLQAANAPRAVFLALSAFFVSYSSVFNSH
jgi:hypothetical protein